MEVFERAKEEVQETDIGDKAHNCCGGPGDGFSTTKLNLGEDNSTLEDLSDED
jgi:hypothetical protein